MRTAQAESQSPNPMSEFLTPGAFVRHPDRPDWGLGQIQSVTGRRVTVNFEGAGKVLILIDHVALVAAEPDRSRSE
jgi:hypothetical protein